MSDKVLVAMRVADARHVCPGSTIGMCKRCESRVWLSPAAQRQIADLEVVCLQCISLDEIGPEPMEPLDKDEVKALGLNPYLTRDELMRMLREWKDRHGRTRP